MARWREASAAAGKSTAMEPSGAIEIVAIDENSAVGDVGAVVEHNPVVVPIVSPVSPSPAKPADEANSKAKAPREPCPREAQSRIPVPVGPDADGISIHKPGIVLRHINNFRVGRFDHNRLSLFGDFLLRCAL